MKNKKGGCRGFGCMFILLCLLMFNTDAVGASAQLPSQISREELLKTSQETLSMPKIEWKETEDIFRISEVGMDWDIGVVVYEPKDVSKIPTGADKKKVGVFLLHGGEGDWRSMEQISR